MVTILLIIGSLFYIQTLGPIDPYHQAIVRILRAELAELPPYPGSTVAQTIVQASLLDYNNNIQVSYGSSGECRAIQDYYAARASTAGWTAHGPVRTLSDGDPQRDQLQGTYRKTVQGHILGLTIGCFVNQSYQGGYVLFVELPPQQ